MKMFITLLLMLIVFGCAPNSQVNHVPKRYPTGRKAKFEVIGIGATCLRCGKEFTVPPDEDGVVHLTTICPECQRELKKER